jgi:hypothetical protein
MMNAVCKFLNHPVDKTTCIYLILIMFINNLLLAQCFAGGEQNESHNKLTNISSLTVAMAMRPVAPL